METVRAVLFAFILVPGFIATLCFLDNAGFWKAFGLTFLFMCFGILAVSFVDCFVKESLDSNVKPENSLSDSVFYL